MSGLLALNRPEVLMILGAGQTQGYRRLSLHPLGSLDDHAYVLNDAGVTSLTIDPNPMFVERAKGLLEKVPGLKQILTIGPVPEELADVAVDLTAEAAKYSPKPLVAAESAARPHRWHGLHRRHDRQTQGRDRHRAVDHHDDDDSARRVGMARAPASS